MKKTYQAPAVKVKYIETNSILAASATGISIKGDAPSNATGLAKQGFFFEDNDQPASNDWLNDDEQ